MFFSYEEGEIRHLSCCLILANLDYKPRLLTWTNLVSRRSICMSMSSQASHIHVSERCRYCSRVEMWVNLRAILVTSGRQSDNNPVSSWKCKLEQRWVHREGKAGLQKLEHEIKSSTSPECSRSLHCCQQNRPLRWQTKTWDHLTDSGCDRSPIPVEWHYI